MSKKILQNRVLIIMLCMAFEIAACQSQKVSTGKFITVKQGIFYKAGKPYYYLGTNFWYGCYLGSKAGYGDRERLKRELDRLSSLGVKNLRILAASENSAISNSLKPAIILEPGKYNEELLEGLDYLLSEMGERDMNGVLFLNNFWEWSGGMSQYRAWVNNGRIMDPITGNATWRDFMNYSSTFYQDTLSQKYYRAYVKMIISRVNSFSGLAYRDDPVIMAWELANEPRGGEGENGLAGMDVFAEWVDKTAAFIHSQDPNHLVTTGSEGTMGCRQDPPSFINSHKTKNIDYLTFHLWPKNWGWFDAKNIDKTFAITKSKAIDYINLHMSLARKLGKPIVLEEFGIERDSSKCAPHTPITARDAYYSLIFRTMVDTAKSAGPFAGCNIWGWGGEGRPVRPDCIYKKGDPFTGDLPQEGQGLNSVFDTDSSTLNIIKSFSEEFRIIAERK